MCSVTVTWISTVSSCTSDLSFSTSALMPIIYKRATLITHTMFTFVFPSKCYMLTTFDAKKAIWQISIYMIFLRIRRLGKFWTWGRQEVMKLKFGKFEIFWECLWKVWDNIQNFWDNFYSYTVLLQQHLLELSSRPPT